MNIEDIENSLRDHTRYEYRLGDYIKQMMPGVSSKNEELGPQLRSLRDKHNGTMGDDLLSYVQSKNIKGTKNVRQAILNFFRNAAKSIADPPYMTIHLRLGDVLDPIGGIKSRGEVHGYLTPLSIYSDMIQDLKKLNPDHHIEIQTGIHKFGVTATAKYLYELNELLDNNGLKPTVNITDPDTAFLRLISSKTLIYCKGGYSQIAAVICQEMGGDVLYAEDLDKRNHFPYAGDISIFDCPHLYK